MCQNLSKRRKKRKKRKLFLFRRSPDPDRFRIPVEAYLLLASLIVHPKYLLPADTFFLFDIVKSRNLIVRFAVAALHLTAVTVVLLITWGISINLFDAREKATDVLATPAPVPKCSLSRVCPPDHFALRVTSGAADVVGPKICFDGKTIMSHVLNNAKPGLNIVVVNGENGAVEKCDSLNMKTGNPEDNLAYLKEIKAGMIVLVASFDDVTTKMTNEMREIFVGMGSTLIQSVKRRDNWVFAGRAGTKIKSLFEKLTVNDEKTNAYEEWPEVVEVGGCFPRTMADVNFKEPLMSSRM